VLKQEMKNKKRKANEKSGKLQKIAFRRIDAWIKEVKYNI